MKTIIDIISGALSENLEAVVLLIVATAIFYLINILFGTIIGAKNDGFNTKKFFSGFLKAIAVCLCIFAFCYTLNLFSLTLKLIDIDISATVITVLEVIGVLVTWDIDLMLEIYEKIKSLKVLKFVTYDIVQINPQSDKGLG